ncbi:MAG: hypothetical protein AB7H97_02895 [Pseudobdellovibrionaceae bacterium]
MKKVFLISCFLFTQSALAIPGLRSDINNFSDSAAGDRGGRTPQSCTLFSGTYRGHCRMGNQTETANLEIAQFGCEEISLDGKSYRIESAIFSQDEEQSIKTSHTGVMNWDRNANVLSYGIFMTALRVSTNQMNMQFNDGVFGLIGDSLSLNGSSTMRWNQDGFTRATVVPFSCNLRRINH